jgi:hypothetical protein
VKLRSTSKQMSSVVFMLIRQDGYKQVFGASTIDFWMCHEQKLYRDYICSREKSPYRPSFRFFDERFEVFTLSTYHKLTHHEMIEKINHWEMILRVVNGKQLKRTDRFI